MRADRSRARARLVLVAVTVVVAVMGTPMTARAHTELVSSSPAPGSEVPLELDRIVLEFGEELLSVGNAIVVHGPNGAEVTVGTAGTSGSTLEAGLVLTTPGQHNLTYRVVGQDGHTITGKLSFTVRDGRPAPAGVVQQQVARGSSAGPVAEPEPVEGSFPVWLPTVGLVLVFLLFAVGGRWARVRVRR